jgi:hypothetical protein
LLETERRETEPRCGEETTSRVTEGARKASGAGAGWLMEGRTSARRRGADSEAMDTLMLSLGAPMPRESRRGEGLTSVSAATAADTSNAASPETLLSGAVEECSLLVWTMSMGRIMAARSMGTCVVSMRMGTAEDRLEDTLSVVRYWTEDATDIMSSQSSSSKRDPGGA